MKEKKTNAMRLLDTAKIAYRVLSYDYDDQDFSGTKVAAQIGLDGHQVFKTLVTQSPKGVFVVCCIPVEQKLDLKALAKAAGQKSLAMLPLTNLLATTGYVRGGCSPMGMKKKYDTYIDESALLCTEMAVSAGVRGQQIVLAPRDLIAAAQAKTGAFATDVEDEDTQ